MTEFKKYRNKETGETVEVKFEEYSECGTFNWQGFMTIKDESGVLIPFNDFIKEHQLIESENDK